jgi:hypothetical protein
VGSIAVGSSPVVPEGSAGSAVLDEALPHAERKREKANRNGVARFISRSDGSRRRTLYRRRDVAASAVREEMSGERCGDGVEV